MITKERLQELIEQGAIIYWIYGKNIEKKTLKHKYHRFFICDNELNEYNAKLGIGIWKHKLSKLFETKEEAEWHKEFGNITRTERLCIPLYEDVINDLKNRSGLYTIVDNIDFCFQVFIDSCNPERNQIWTTGLHDMRLTKENYTIACRKCKELFLGGQNG